MRGEGRQTRASPRLRAHMPQEQTGNHWQSPFARLPAELPFQAEQSCQQSRRQAGGLAHILLDVVVVIHNVLRVQHPLVRGAVVEAALQLAQGHNVAAAGAG